ncbi:10661_t:CDS:2 [Entrophospora sp. SA101]|nr:10661_t:CDS:2 [Entrophospora sp. SA101]
MGSKDFIIIYANDFTVDDGMKDCSTDYGFCRVSSHDLPDGTTYCTHMIVQGHIGGNNRYIEASDTACFHLHGNVFHWTFDQIDCHHYCYPDPSFYVISEITSGTDPGSKSCCV